MIKIFLGEDTEKARKAMHAQIDAVKSSETASVRRFSDIGFSLTEANEAVYEQNLFGGKNIVVFEGILDAPEAEKFYAKSLKESPNSIFIRETAPNKDILEIFKHIGTVLDFSVPKKEKKSPIAFAIADAYASRDKKRAWVLYRKAIAEGNVPEEIHGTIFWATKLLYLTRTEERENAIAGGVSAYNYARYLGWSKKFLQDELQSDLRTLVRMYHEAHRKDVSLENSLERFLIS